MPKEVKISFSREHQSKSNPEPHVDVHRRASDAAKSQKIDHSPVNPGYGSTPANVNVRKMPSAPPEALEKIRAELAARGFKKVASGTLTQEEFLEKLKRDELPGIKKG
jgi:hypothetical protein